MAEELQSDTYGIAQLGVLKRVAIIRTANGATAGNIPRGIPHLRCLLRIERAYVIEQPPHSEHHHSHE